MEPSAKMLEALMGLTEQEQKQLLHSLTGSKPTTLTNHAFGERHVKFGYYSDPHVGHKMFSEALWMKMLSYFKREGVERIYSPGDNLEGMSGRPGHIYELAQIGATAQMEYASELFACAPSSMHFYIIDGNHDQWFKEKNNAGLIAGEELARRNKNVSFLGEWEADIQMAKGVIMRLFHSNDGTAYADSYKLQKLIESFTGGQKPNIILSGHCNGVLISLYR